MKNRLNSLLSLILRVSVRIIISLIIFIPGIISPQTTARTSLDYKDNTPSQASGDLSRQGVDAPKAESSAAASQTLFLPMISNQNIQENVISTQDWSMAAANPERTSATAEEVRGSLKPLWFKPFKPYILPRVQIITADGTLFVSTASGLYALDANSGAEKWIYSTELPLGHSPTVHEGVVYVGGFDRKIHAIDADNGMRLWTFTAGAGFDTNPLIVGDKLYAGNRDGNFYAVYIQGTNTGKQAWKYTTGGPIHFSAAYKGGVVYFASDDSHAYALNANNGQLVWKSDQLLGAGFHSWWPVIYQDYIIFAGSNNYRSASEYGTGSIHTLDETDVYPNRAEDPKGTFVGPVGAVPGDWVAGTPTIDTSNPNITPNGSTLPITEYLEQTSWRRTNFVLNRVTGEEYTTDFDQDGKSEYAPFLWFGTYTGNRYPPVVGIDGVLYQTNNYMSDPAIAGGQIVGWKIGTPYISIITSSWNAVDEPEAYSVGGKLIYWNRCCDRVSGAIDVTIPHLPNTAKDRIYNYFSYNLDEIIPGYNVMYGAGPNGVSPTFGGQDGVYGFHGDQNPPIPYNGRVYMHRSNAILAFGSTNSSAVELPAAQPVPAQDETPTVTVVELKARLEKEVLAIVDAGHLRPGFIHTGLFDLHARFTCGDYLLDYWHQPVDTIYTLVQAYPLLSPGLQQLVKIYLQQELAAYPPYKYNHTGWQTGAAREIYITPPEVQSKLATIGPSTVSGGFDGWTFSPHIFYGLWKYAQLFGEAATLFDASKGKLQPAPADSILAEMPHVHNAYIAGYLGYLELEKLAGYPETTSVRSELNRLLALRASTFTYKTPDAYYSEQTKFYCRTINAARNFMYLVPELGQYLHDNALPKAQEALAFFDAVAPYWFVTRSETTLGEGVTSQLYDSNAIFHAKAWILQEPWAKLANYVDIPGFHLGDLFYIQKLVTAIEAGNQQMVLSQNGGRAGCDKNE